MYQAFCEAGRKYGDQNKLDDEMLFDLIEQQCADGIAFMAIHDSSDRAQIQELVINCELAEIGRKMGCQMLVEGPGHVPLDEIEGNIQLQKRRTSFAT